MKPKSLKLSEIITDAGTQIRAAIDEQTVIDYAALQTDATVKMPPVIVFFDGTRHILADGFHRVLAAHRNEFKDILADVRNGTKADALKYALSANTAHGLRRSNADKRRSVELALAEWPALSDREIEKICAVCDTFVAKVRSEIQPPTVGSSTRTGADGKQRKLPAKKTKPQPEEPNEMPHIQSADVELKEPAPRPIGSNPDDVAALTERVKAANEAEGIVGPDGDIFHAATPMTFSKWNVENFTPLFTPKCILCENRCAVQPISKEVFGTWKDDLKGLIEIAADLPKPDQKKARESMIQAADLLSKCAAVLRAEAKKI